MKKQLVTLSVIVSLTSCSFFNSQPTASPSPEPLKPIEQTKTEPQKEDEGDLYSTYKVPQEQTVQRVREEVYIKDKEAKLAQPTAPTLSVAASALGRASGNIHLSKKMMVAADQIGGSGSEGYFYPAPNTESYDSISENSFHQCKSQPLSTFSIDVDTASYSNMRRMISQGVMPNKDAIRIEELINYFDYDYEAPKEAAFSVNLETAPALWNKKHKLVRIGIKGKEINVNKRPASNLVFLIDVSGSMDNAEKLPLVKSALGMLVDKLGSNDKISIIVYAGAAGMVLSPTTGDKKTQILRSLDNLKAGGSTNGGGGIELAYKTASENFIKGGVNRVILATDGDFNVGTVDRESLVSLVEKNGKKNIYLSILGFGMGNYKDGLMETLSNKGNGNYAYIDNQLEARKVMVEQLSGTLVTIAKDVKIQVEFNPKFVESYRLVGYENRVLKNEDFNNDAKDAGDIGAGHTVTALYEIVPVGSGSTVGSVDALKYQKIEKAAAKTEEVSNDSNELLTLKIRYKKPDGDVSAKQEFTLAQQDSKFDKASDSFKFSSAVALFGMLLRNSEHVQDGSYEKVLEVAKKSKGEDKNQYRQEFIDLVKKVEGMKVQPQQAYLEE
ncbi:VWA domain-containing protein [bacterium]|nr:VWA domain-containing protein [bacterium]